MHRKSILRTLPCDVKKLPIGALEAFVLSQVHGDASVEDVAAASGMEIDDLVRVATKLAECGALSVDGKKSRTRAPPPPASRRATVAPARKRETSPPPSRRRSPASVLPPTLVPKPRPHGDVRSLGIGARDGFVLSQVDGCTSVADLAEIARMSAEDLAAALRELERAGAVDLGKAARSLPLEATKNPKDKTSSVRPAGACELTEAERARITEVANRIGTVDLYAVLGVARDADGKAIRRAYHALAAEFHTDRYFGKSLGPMKRPLEGIFVRLTHAYETLSRKDARAAYDATLPPPPSKRAPTQRPQRRTSRPAAAVVSTVREREAPTAPAPETARAPRAAVPASVPKVEPAAVAKPAPVVPATAATPATPATSASRPDPRRRNIQHHLDVFIRAAEEAMARDDVVAAAQHYRLALQCGDDPALRALVEQTEAKAKKRVRETSLAAARAAEQGGRWSEAAAKYAKAHSIQAEPAVAERAANAMRLDGKDLRGAARLAEQAVLAEPNNAAFHVTLGEIYYDAGLQARAQGESSRALALAPNDLRALALSKLVAKAKRA
jgi:curved DNA-binding protein CbpA